MQRGRALSCDKNHFNLLWVFFAFSFLFIIGRFLFKARFKSIKCYW